MKILLIINVILINIFLSNIVFSQTKSISTSNSISFFNTLYNYHFFEVDSILNINEKKNTNKLYHQYLKINYFWWQLISGNTSYDYYRLCMNTLDDAESFLNINKIKNDSDVFYRLFIYGFRFRLEIFKSKVLGSLKYLNKCTDYIKYVTHSDKNNEYFKLISGVYLYMIDYAKNKYPYLYPVLLFYPSGNKSLGLNMLKECSKSTNLYIKTEANYFLLKIFRDAENKYSDAELYAKKLITDFPLNLVFRYEYFKIYSAQKDLFNMKDKFHQIEIFADKNIQINFSQKEHFIKIGQTNIHLIKQN